MRESKFEKAYRLIMEEMSNLSDEVVPNELEMKFEDFDKESYQYSYMGYIRELFIENGEVVEDHYRGEYCITLDHIATKEEILNRLADPRSDENFHMKDSYVGKEYRVQHADIEQIQYKDPRVKRGFVRVMLEPTVEFSEKDFNNVYRKIGKVIL